MLDESTAPYDLKARVDHAQAEIDVLARVLKDAQKQAWIGANPAADALRRRVIDHLGAPAGGLDVPEKADVRYVGEYEPTMFHAIRPPDRWSSVT